MTEARSSDTCRMRRCLLISKSRCFSLELLLTPCALGYRVVSKQYVTVLSLVAFLPFSPPQCLQAPPYERVIHGVACSTGMVLEVGGPK